MTTCFDGGTVVPVRHSSWHSASFSFYIFKNLDFINALMLRFIVSSKLDSDLQIYLKSGIN